jgi:prepilin-type N-terminal cleavage/methylation domain-containing protein
MSWRIKAFSRRFSVFSKSRLGRNFFLFCADSRKLRAESQSGFSLVEVLVAIVILSTGFVFVAQAMGRTQEALRISQNLLKASQIAEERLAELEVQLREFGTVSSASKFGEEKFPGNRNYSWSQRVSPHYGKGVEDATRISQGNITVAWKEGVRENKESLSSLLKTRKLKDQPI